MRQQFVWTQVQVLSLKIDMGAHWEPGLSLLIQVDFFLIRPRLPKYKAIRTFIPDLLLPQRL